MEKINKLLNSNKLLTEIYFDIQKEYEKNYPNVVVLMEIGSFFEIYEFDGIGKAKEIAFLLNIQLTKKNKSIKEVDIKNPLMAGFPSAALDRYLERLIEEKKYTIVIIKQKGIPPNVKRYVSDVISPGVNLDTKEIENYLTSIIIEKYKGNFFVGYANVDISTGKSFVFEGYSVTEDNTFALDEVFRLIKSYKTSEVILTLRGVEEQEISSYLELDMSLVINTTRLDIDYQNEIFKKVYNIKSLLTPIEIMNLEKYPLATESLAILLEFIIAHSKEIVCNLKPPILIENSKFVYLGNNPIYQLEVDKVLKLIDKTKTALGKRLLKERLFNPITDKNELIERYKAVDFMLNRYKEFEEDLSGIYDLEKIYRKIELKKLHPFEIQFLILSLQKVSNIYVKLSKKSTHIDNLISFLQNNLIEDKLIYKITEIKDSFFKEGVFEDLDEVVEKKQYYVNLLQKIKKEIENLENNIKVEILKTDKEGYYLSITKSRFKLIKDKFNEKFIELDNKKIFFKDFDVKHLTNNIKIKGGFIEEINEKIIFYEQKIIDITTNEYYKFLDILGEKSTILDKIIPTIAKVDVAFSSAKVAKLYNYTKPEIIDTKKTFIKELRHPLIEVNEANGVYVANDIDFNEYDGMLLYGINSSGKSSLMKSVGIAVILAQSGFFVPATSMKLRIFDAVFTRIEAKDNLSKGLSTFAVEMLELKNIFNRATRNSLVLGDEIAHGTETLSALSIVASAVLKLTKKGVNFIFATHLHQLMNLKEIQNLKGVVAKHLEVYFDGEKLIYNRKLQDGSGSSVYGLEFAKSIQMDREFLNIANKIRKELVKEYDELEALIKNRRSRYNKRVFVTTCAICGDVVDDVHHIKERKLSKDGFIGHINVNHKYNLIPLCKKHHQMVHKGEIIIKGFVTTSEGIELHFDEVKNGN